MDKKFWKDKRVLITGASGFIGSHIYNFLKRNSVNVFGLDAIENKKQNIEKINIIEYKIFSNFCKKNKISTIIHFAAVEGNLEFKKNNAAKIISDSIKMTLNILDIAKTENMSEIVLPSSSHIYRSEKKIKFTEKDDYLSSPIKIENTYASSKIIMELIAQSYKNSYKGKIFIPRPVNIYGPGDLKNRVVSSIINKTLNNETIEIWGDKNKKIQFIYIDDFINSIIKMIEYGKFRILNITGNDNISLEKLANTIKKIVDKNNHIKYIKNENMDKRAILLDNKKLKSIIDHEFTTFSEGLKKTIQSNKHENKK